MKKRCLIVLAALLALFAMVSCVSTEAEVPTTPLPPTVKSALNPDAPYDTVYWGLFDNQKAVGVDPTAPRGAENPKTAEATYSVFIPEHTQTRSPLVMVLTPANTTAAEFARSEEGMKWMAAADGQHKFAVAFIEPVDGGMWNIYESKGGRDEALAVYGVFKQLNSTKKSENAYYSLDKNRISLIGYREGGEAALLAASTYPAVFANLTLVDIDRFNEGLIEKHLEKDALPYLTGNNNGLGEVSNSEIAMPVTVVNPGKKEAGKAACAFFQALAERFETEDRTFNRDLLSVKEVRKATPKKLYDGFMSLNGRYLGYPGGTIRENFELDDKGFQLVDEKLEDGTFNRYLTYVPASYKEGTAVPLVVALHGSSAALSDLISESRWSELADENGFIVLYVQAPIGGKEIFKPDWPMFGPGAMQQILHDVEAVKAAYTIDDGRVYLTGHSAGGMTIGLAILPQANDTFTAYAINGGVMAGFPGPNGPFNPENVKSTGKILPMIGFMAEYDGFPYMPQMMMDHIKAFGNYSGLDTSKDLIECEVQEGYPADKYEYYDYRIGDTPIVRYTTVMESPHTFMAEEAALSWDFFKAWERTDEGLAYNGELVPVPAN